MGLTRIAAYFFPSRQEEIERHAERADLTQQQVLQHLLERAEDAEYGRNHLSDGTKTYEDFAKDAPANIYEELKGGIDHMRHGEENILWSGRVKWYAKSSGATDDKSKFIPVLNEGLSRIYYQGGKDTVALYLRSSPDSRVFDGKGLMLGGSHPPNYNLHNSLVGDSSVILIENINPLVSLVRVSKESAALLQDFGAKRDRVAYETSNQNVTNFSGVPSWTLSVLVRVMELSGKRHLEGVWPNLEVFFHGGIAFMPYHPQREQFITSSNVHYMETYNASGGFPGIQGDPGDVSMLLMTDYDVLYEFTPMGEYGTEYPTALSLADMKLDKNYAVFISTSCGLWRYMIDDTVKFTSCQPYGFIITGRTKCFINVYGEEFIIDNAEKKLAYAYEQTVAEIKEYTATPVYMNNKVRCRHQWLIKSVRTPSDLKEFADILDKQLQELSSDYEAECFRDIVLQHLGIIVACPNLFNDWLKMKGKLDGQHEIPRLSNSRRVIEEPLKLN